MAVHRFYDNNPFCSLFIDYYDFYMNYDKSLNNIHTPMIANTTVSDKKKLSFFSSNKKEEHITDDIPETVQITKENNLNDSKKELSESSFTTQGITFEVLWDFVEFVEFAKKSILYSEKGESSKTYIKNDEDSIEHRYISINYEENDNLIFDIYNIPNPASINGKYIKCIKIIITTPSLTTTMLISDASIDFKDDSDIYLMNTINYILCKECTNKFDNIFKSLNIFFTSMGII